MDHRSKGTPILNMLRHQSTPTTFPNKHISDRIVLVDDDPPHRTCLKKFLELRGYVCLEASNGVDALDILRQESVAMIITDHNMPEMDGLTFIQQVNQNFPNEILPIFLITAELSDTIRLRAFKNGVNRVFEKPLDYQDLCNAVDWVMKFDLVTPPPIKFASH